MDQASAAPDACQAAAEPDRSAIGEGVEGSFGARMQRRGQGALCWTPYWNEHLYKHMTGESIEGSLFE